MKEATSQRRVEISDIKCKCKCAAAKQDIATMPKAKAVGKRHKTVGPTASSCSMGPAGAPSDASHPNSCPSPKQVLSLLGAYLVEPGAGTHGQASATKLELLASTRRRITTESCPPPHAIAIMLAGYSLGGVRWVPMLGRLRRPRRCRQRRRQRRYEGGC